MSCDWRIWCLDCEDEHYFSDANHQEDLMRQIIEIAPQLAALGKTFVGAGGDAWVETYYGRVDTRWFAKHEGHRLVPRTEYGRNSDECGEKVKCLFCDADHRCRLPPSHAGAHDRRRPPAPVPLEVP